MATAASVRVVKEFTYRGATKRFSNRYHFHPGDPATGADWDTLMDAIVADEKTIYESGVEIVECVGTKRGAVIPAHTKAYSVTGTGSFGFFDLAPGDCAALVKYLTTKRSTKNHPVYCFNYYHGVGKGGGGDPDALNLDQKTAMEAYAHTWIVTGYSDGTDTNFRCDPTDEDCTTRTVEGFLTHRDFPR